ncbi:MAG: FlgD immunoglobulin-like domain containing protein [Thermodesulfobacteriota bacterium]
MTHTDSQHTVPSACSVVAYSGLPRRHASRRGNDCPPPAAPAGSAGPWLVFLLLLLGAWPQHALAAPAIGPVQVQPAAISSGQQVVFSFLLEQAATLRATVLGPDGREVAVLIDGQQRPAGLVSLTWDGRDHGGALVPDEAYTLGMTAAWEDGTTTAYEPLAASGGERLELGLSRSRTMAGKEIIDYRLDIPARVTVRAGIRGGAMLRTVVDNEPKLAGQHRLEWDGRDDTGRFDVTAMPDNTLTISGTRLPDATVIVTGIGGDYLAYRQGTAQGRTTAVSSPKALPAPRFAAYAGRTAARAAQATAPARTPLGGKGVETVKGTMDITLEIDPSYSEIFNNSRFETVVFVDGERFDEEENSYSPYTYQLDTTRIGNGPHLITINQVGLTGQIGSYSFTVEINN